MNNPRSRVVSRVDVVSIALVVAQLAGSALAYANLPDRVPTHFDINGAPDGFSSRVVGALALPVSSIAIGLFVRSVPRFMKGEARARALGSPIAEVTALVIGLLAGIHFVILDMALSGAPRAGRGLALVLSVFTLIMGLLMPKLRRNGVAGIRTPFSLSSDEAWQKTHRVGGALFVGAGLVGLVGVVTGSVAWVCVPLIAAALVASVYSYFASRGAAPS